VALQFVGKDPESDTNNCPSVSVDEETGDFLLCGWTVTDLETVAAIAAHAPIAEHESVIRIPVRMREILLEALHGQGAAVQRADRSDDALSSSLGTAGHLHA
jgi:hypothetical protein